MRRLDDGDLWCSNALERSLDADEVDQLVSDAPPRALRREAPLRLLKAGGGLANGAPHLLEAVDDLLVAPRGHRSEATRGGSRVQQRIPVPLGTAGELRFDTHEP